MNVRDSFSMKNIFNDKMNFELFDFYVTKRIFKKYPPTCSK